MLATPRQVEKISNSIRSLFAHLVERSHDEGGDQAITREISHTRHI